MALVRGVLASLASLALLTACSGDGGRLRSLASPPATSTATEAVPAPTPSEEMTDWTAEGQADAMLVTAVSMWWEDYADEQWRADVCEMDRDPAATMFILVLMRETEEVPAADVIDWTASETKRTVIEMLDARC